MSGRTTIIVDPVVRDRLKKASSKDLTYSEFISQLLDLKEKYRHNE